MRVAAGAGLQVPARIVDLLPFADRHPRQDLLDRICDRDLDASVECHLFQGFDMVCCFRIEILARPVSPIGLYLLFVK